MFINVDLPCDVDQVTFIVSPRGFREHNVLFSGSRDRFQLIFLKKNKGKIFEGNLHVQLFYLWGTLEKVQQFEGPRDIIIYSILG